MDFVMVFGLLEIILPFTNALKIAPDFDVCSIVEVCLMKNKTDIFIQI